MLSVSPAIAKPVGIKQDGLEMEQCVEPSGGPLLHEHHGLKEDERNRMLMEDSNKEIQHQTEVQERRELFLEDRPREAEAHLEAAERKDMRAHDTRMPQGIIPPLPAPDPEPPPAHMPTPPTTDSHAPTQDDSWPEDVPRPLEPRQKRHPSPRPTPLP